MAQFQAHNFGEEHHHITNKTSIPSSLSSCAKVSLKIDQVRKPLEAPYMGPYKILTWSTKNFMIDMNNGNHAQVSIDRLKPYIGPTKNKLNPSNTDKANKN